MLVGSGVSYSITMGNIILSGWCFLAGPGRGSPVLIQGSLVFSTKEAPSGEDDASLHTTIISLRRRGINPGPEAGKRSGTCACHREEAVRPTRRSLRQLRRGSRPGELTLTLAPVEPSQRPAGRIGKGPELPRGWMIKRGLLTPTSEEPS